ncbi:MAG: hypothetical protein R3D66_01970 [Alphaproteobacteria bacterium]
MTEHSKAFTAVEKGCVKMLAEFMESGGALKVTGTRERLIPAEHIRGLRMQGKELQIFDPGLRQPDSRKDNDEKPLGAHIRIVGKAHENDGLKYDGRDGFLAFICPDRDIYLCPDTADNQALLEGAGFKKYPLRVPYSHGYGSEDEGVDGVLQSWAQQRRCPKGPGYVPDI